MSSKISNYTELTAAEIAALDLDVVVDASAGTSGTKKMYAMSKALGLSKLLYFADTGGDDAYVISTGLSLSTLTAGFAFALKVTTANTGACTLAVDSVSAVAIKVVDASGVRDPLTGEIAAGMTALLSYNGTYFILLNPVTNKKYTAFLTQSTGEAPVASTVANTFATVPTYSWSDTGVFVISLPAGYTYQNVRVEIYQEPTGGKIAKIAYFGGDLAIYTGFFAIDGANIVWNISDNVLSNTLIVISTI